MSHICIWVPLLCLSVSSAADLTATGEYNRVYVGTLKQVADQFVLKLVVN